MSIFQRFLPITTLSNPNKFGQRWLKNDFHTSRVRRKEKCRDDTSKYEVSTITDNMVDPCKAEPAVIIIGAGIAGLSAGQRLKQSGITNFVILEATDRPGGRIHSCWLGDVIAEVGCGFIKGASVANPLYNLACQEGLLTPPTPRVDETARLWCTSDGRGVDMPISLTAYNTFKQIEHEASQLFTMGCTKEHGSLMQFLTLRIMQELQNFPEEQRYDASRVMFGMTHCLRAKASGIDLNRVSADNIGSYISIPGGDISIPLGFVGVLAPIVRDLPDCAVKYLKPVSNIKWGTTNIDGPRVLVRCCDGDEIPGDYCIVTVSLGVLKQNADKLFCPQLPADKMEAINSIGFGQVDKVYLDYSRPFWLWHEGSISFGWSQDELNNRKDWTKGLCHIEEAGGSKHVLCAYVTGDEAVEMEKASDEEVAEGVTRVLRQFTGDATLPYPSTILRSKWGTDPFFYGSHSYLGLKSSIGHQCDLSCPLPGPCDPSPPMLLFAGEATIPGHYSTCHGARISGVREAERIIQLTQKFGGPPPK